MATPFVRTLRSIKQDNSSFALLTWALVLLLFGAWLAWFMLIRISVYEVSQTARLQVEHASHPVSNAIAGTIVSSKLRLGAQVQQGDILLELEANNERLRLHEEQTRLEGIPPQIHTLEQEILDYQNATEKTDAATANAIDQAKSRYHDALAAARFSDNHWNRLRTLNESGQIPQVDVLRARRDADKSRALANELGAEIKRLNADGSEKKLVRQATVQSLQREIIALQAQMALSRATIKRLLQNIETHTIKAPVSGVMGEVSAIEKGAYIQSGTVLARIIPSGDLTVVAEFAPARVLGRVHPGQQGHMRLHGFPWAQYGSIAVRVERVASEIRNGLLRVELQPLVAHAVLMQHGLSGSVEVEVEKTTPAVLVLRVAGQMLTRAARPSATVLTASTNHADTTLRTLAAAPP